MKQHIDFTIVTAGGMPGYFLRNYSSCLYLLPGLYLLDFNNKLPVRNIYQSLVDYILAYEIEVSKDEDWQHKRDEKRREFEANLEKADLELEAEGIEVQCAKHDLQSCALYACIIKLLCCGRFYLCFEQFLFSFVKQYLFMVS